MSDILEKLLGVEKRAAVLVADADAEASRRKNLARTEAQREYERIIAGKMTEIEGRISEEAGRLKVEREKKSQEHRQGLSALPLRMEEFRRTIFQLIRKGSR